MEDRASIRRVITATFPIAITMMSQTIMSATDTLFMGWIGRVEQGAVGVAGTLLWTFCSVVCGSLTAITTFVSQGIGAGRGERVGGWIWVGIFISIVGSIVTYLIFLTTPFILGYIIKIPAQIIKSALSYMEIRMYGIFFILLNFTYSSFLRGVEDMKTPMWITIVVNIINVIGNYFLVLGKWGCPKLGIEGAAYASVIATIIATILYIYTVMFKQGYKRYNPWKLPESLLKKGIEVIKIGLPIGGNWFLEMVSWTIFTTIVASFGEIEAASHNIAFQWVNLSFLPGVAISVAATTLIGKEVGAENREGAFKIGRLSIILGILWMGTMGLIFFFFGKTLMSIFTKDEGVIELGEKLLKIAALFQLFDALTTVISGVLRGAGDTRFPFIVTVISSWIIFTPSVIVFGKFFNYGAVGSWFGALLHLAITGIILTYRFLNGKWYHIGVVLKENV